MICHIKCHALAAKNQWSEEIILCKVASELQNVQFKNTIYVEIWILTYLVAPDTLVLMNSEPINLIS